MKYLLVLLSLISCSTAPKHSKKPKDSCIISCMAKDKKYTITWDYRTAELIVGHCKNLMTNRECCQYEDGSYNPCK